MPMSLTCGAQLFHIEDLRKSVTMYSQTNPYLANMENKVSS